MYPLTTKFLAFDTFLKLKVYDENMLSLKIKAFRLDGDGEFKSTRFKNFFASHGIEHRLSCAHTPAELSIVIL